jgi:carbonic anhydrase/acetyltransferase-like protein (isoleucine patch superfamily)
MIIEFDGKKPRVAPGAFVAPTAVLVGDVTVEEGVSIWFGAVLRGDFGKITVGRNTSVQDNVVVHIGHDGETIIGEDVTVGHGAVLHNCTIKRGAAIGMGAVVLDFSEIGEYAMVAAGSVVPPNMVVPDRYLAAGVPAEVKKEISGPSMVWVMASPPLYREMADRYLKQGLGLIK